MYILSASNKTKYDSGFVNINISFYFHTRAEDIMLSVKSLQRSEGAARSLQHSEGDPDPIKYKKLYQPHKVYIFLICKSDDYII